MIEGLLCNPCVLNRRRANGIWHTRLLCLRLASVMVGRTDGCFFFFFFLRETLIPRVSLVCVSSPRYQMYDATQDCRESVYRHGPASLSYSDHASGLCSGGTGSNLSPDTTNNDGYYLRDFSIYPGRYPGNAPLSVRIISFQILPTSILTNKNLHSAP